MQSVQVELINEESLSILKKDGYASSANEKETRGCLKSATEHNLGKDSFVIVDSLNYIKGYRYELYCAARTSRIPHCVLWVTAPQSCSDQWNQQRIDEGKDAYSMETYVYCIPCTCIQTFYNSAHCFCHYSTGCTNCV